MSTHPDNVAPVEHDATTEVYLKRFDDLDKELMACRATVALAREQPDAFTRGAVLMDYAEMQQKALESIYDLLVEMNNYFGNGPHGGS